MMEHLIIRIFEHPTAGLYAEWALFNEGIKTKASEGVILLAELHNAIPQLNASERRIVVLVPGPQVLLTKAEVPPKQRRHIGKVLPFLIEDQLAEDITQLHFASGTQEYEDGTLPAAAVRKSLMQHWLQGLSDARLLPQFMLPETLLVPSHPQAWCLLHDGHTVWLRTAPESVFAMEAAMLSGLLSVLVDKHAPGSIPIMCYLSQAAQEDGTARQLMQLQQQYPQLLFSTQHADSIMDILCNEYLYRPNPHNPVFSLLQGEFQPSSSHSPSAAAWRKLARIAALWFVAMVMITWVEALYFSFKSDQLRDESIALYQQLFPQDSKVVDPVHQMKNHLRMDTSMEEGGFLAMLGKLAVHWKAKENPSAQMQNLAYRDDEHTITLNLTAKSMETMNALTQQLSGDGLETKILSVVSDKDSFKGQIAVKDTEK